MGIHLLEILQFTATSIEIPSAWNPVKCASMRLCQGFSLGSSGAASSLHRTVEKCMDNQRNYKINPAGAQAGLSARAAEALCLLWLQLQWHCCDSSVGHQGQGGGGSWRERVSCRQEPHKGTPDPASSMRRGASLHRDLKHGMHPAQGFERRILGLSVLLSYCLVPVLERRARFSLKKCMEWDICGLFVPLRKKKKLTQKLEI